MFKSGRDAATIPVMSKPKRHYENAGLLWLDLEMTGLNSSIDRILELACIATKFDFEPLATYESGVLQDESEIKSLLEANEFAKSRPAETAELIRVSLDGRPEPDVERAVIDIINTQFGDADVYLAGNSIHADRGFIKKWMPALDARLDYRMLDVSAWKLVYEANHQHLFKKAERHRALDDIKESIGELKFYTRFIKP